LSSAPDCADRSAKRNTPAPVTTTESAPETRFTSAAISSG